MTRPLELALTFLRLQNHSFTYDEPIKVESVTQAVCDLALRFGEGADEEEASMVRSLLLPPYSPLLTLAPRSLGRSVLLFSLPATTRVADLSCEFLRMRRSLRRADWSTPSSYHADPSGTFMRYDAKAIGSGSEGAQNELQDSYNKVRSFRRSFLLGPSLTLVLCSR